jgi:hypothetical protein
LVAAPVGASKDYALDRWVAATNAYDRLLVTNEPEYTDRIESLGVPWALYTYTPHPRRQGRHAIHGPMYNAAWKAIIANATDYTHILSLESDVIPEGDILTVMEEQYDEGFLRHGVPWRSVYRRPGNYAYENACTMATIEDWKAAVAKAESLGELSTVFEVVGHPDYFPHKDILVMKMEHLDDGIDARV